MRNRKAQILQVAVPLLALVGLSGCMQSPSRLDFHSETTAMQHQSIKADAPPVYLAEIKDDRVDQEKLGFIGLKSFSSDNLLTWLNNELHAQAAARVRLIAAHEKQALIIEPRLLKLYIEHISITKTAVMVIGLTFIAPNGTSQQVVYRGQYAGINWWNSDAEIKGALTKAMEDCLGKCLPDIATQAAASLHSASKPVALLAPQR